MKPIHAFAILLLLSLSACIPSLHSIVTDENRVTQDELLGLWLSEPLGIPGVKIRADHPVEGDDSTKVAESKDVISDSEGNQWLFERVGKISFKKDEKSATIDPAVASLMDWQIEEATYFDYYMLTFTHWEKEDTTTERMWCHLTRIEGELFVDFSPSYLKNPVYNEDARFGTNYIMGHTFAKLEIKNNELHLQSLNGDFISKLIEEKRIRLKHEVVDEQIILTASTEELRAFIARYLKDPQLYGDREVLISV